ncbi:MAG: A/G-specific adenine glycosylase [Chloroflexota bacterium]|nr:A/G-specific adenine glycosylase [Chloroflexota bacterium]
MTSRLSSKLLAWYRDNKRTLPWRVPNPDPYAVWVSEIMLQQTRVETVIPYFEKWLGLFPNIRALANASEQDVLNAWEGLGYYSRARNLHKAAKIVVHEHAGQLPRDLLALRKLPGIGRYTLGAIASIAFGMDIPALDGNIRRVYSRLFDIAEPADAPVGERILWQLAGEQLPKGQAGDYNQALMDLGATICLPKNPRCLICPLMKVCKARKNGTQEQRPVLKPRKEVPEYVHAAGVMVRRMGREASPNGDNPPYTQVLLAQRPSKGLLGGMWEFPNGRVNENPAKELAKVLKTGYSLKVRLEAGEAKDRPHPHQGKAKELAIVQHAYTHFKVMVHAFQCELLSDPNDGNLDRTFAPAAPRRSVTVALTADTAVTDRLRAKVLLKWVALDELDDYPMGKIDRQIAQKAQEYRLT